MLIDRDPRHARWCSACQCYHEAFIGDGWAETDPKAGAFFLQPRRHADYYVCMEDGIFQVTEWAQCQKIAVEPNTHRVPFTITTNPQAVVPPLDKPSKDTKKKNAGFAAPGAKNKKPRARR